VGALQLIFGSLQVARIANQSGVEFNSKKRERKIVAPLVILSLTALGSHCKHQNYGFHDSLSHFLFLLVDNPTSDKLYVAMKRATYNLRANQISLKSYF
jgi:hypothetical protein